MLLRVGCFFHHHKRDLLELTRECKGDSNFEEVFVEIENEFHIEVLSFFFFKNFRWLTNLATLNTPRDVFLKKSRVPCVCQKCVKV